MKLVPIILCGGAGTRLWPVSRESMPKPFIRLANGRSLLQSTAERVTGLDGIVQLAVVTNVAYSYKVVEDLAAANLPHPLTLLLEPEAQVELDEDGNPVAPDTDATPKKDSGMEYLKRVIATWKDQ